MNFDISRIALSQIDLKDETFRITTSIETKDLENSIRSVGLIHPPILMAVNSKYIIISGFRRIKAVRNIGQDQTTAAIGRWDANDLQYAKLAIVDNLSHRDLNWVEISRSLNLLLRLLKDRSRLSHVAQQIGLPCEKPMIEKALKIGFLVPEIKKGLASGRISLPAALTLGEFDTPSATLLSLIFQELVLSLNKQREVLTLLKEISLRDNTSVLSVIAKTGIEDIIKKNDLDRGQAARMFRTKLRRLRFPVLTRHESAFHDYIKSLKLSSNIKMAAPRDFEGLTYTLRLQFNNVKELSDCRIAVDKIIRHPQTKSMIE